MRTVKTFCLGSSPTSGGQQELIVVAMNGVFSHCRRIWLRLDVLKFLGRGADNEQIELERVHSACWLVHCKGNTQSPFEFTNESDARQFADFVMERIGEL